MQATFATSDSEPLQRQLLLQLGARLRSARTARGISGVDLAAQLRISRTTLLAVEQGKPSPSMGTYVSVMAALGLVGDVALLGTGESDTAVPPPPKSMALHAAQDYQSLLMHVEAVRLVKRDPRLAQRAVDALERWRATVDPRSMSLLDEWARILAEQDWHAAIARTERGNQLRQASPLGLVLPKETRLAIICKVKAMSRAARGVQAAEPAHR